MEYKCLCCNKNYQQKFDEKLKEKILKRYKSFNHDSFYFIVEKRCVSLWIYG